MKSILAIVLSLLAIVLTITTCNTSCNMTNDAAKTIEDQYKASALLKKYEYFKDLSGGIDKKDADIQMYQNEISTMKVVDKEDKFYVQQRKSELMGIISVRNQMCADYNIAMSKFNYSFCNKGTLPQTNLEPLPREYKPYINNLK